MTWSWLTSNPCVFGMPPLGIHVRAEERQAARVVGVAVDARVRGLEAAVVVDRDRFARREERPRALCHVDDPGLADRRGEPASLHAGDRVESVECRRCPFRPRRRADPGSSVGISSAVVSAVPVKKPPTETARARDATSGGSKESLAAGRPRAASRHSRWRIRPPFWIAIGVAEKGCETAVNRR